MVCKLRPKLEMGLGHKFPGVVFCGGAGKRLSWVDLGHSLGMLHVFMCRGGDFCSVKQPSGYLTLPSGLCCFYLWKVEEKRSKKQQHKKNQRIHDYTAKLRNRTYGGNISLQTCLI